MDQQVMELDYLRKWADWMLIMNIKNQLKN
jgi:hypothetical protein